MLTRARSSTRSQVQQQDSQWSAASSGRHSPAIGAAASLVAAGLSGFAGVYLEMMFTRGTTSIWMRNLQLTIFTLPLQASECSHGKRVVVVSAAVVSVAIVRAAIASA